MIDTRSKQKYVVLWYVLILVVVVGMLGMVGMLVDDPADAPVFDIYNMDDISMIDVLIQKYDINKR